MENLRQIAKQAPGELLKTSQASSESTERALVIAKWLAAAKVHYRLQDEVSEANAEIYLSGLRDVEPERIDEAFARCFKECDFFPKLADVFRMMPQARSEPVSVVKIEKYFTDRGIKPESWVEELGSVRYHFYGDPKGYKCITKAEPLNLQEQ